MNNHSLPSQLQGFYFEKVLKNFHPASSYIFAHYLSSEKQRVFAKVWLLTSGIKHKKRLESSVDILRRIHEIAPVRIDEISKLHFQTPLVYLFTSFSGGMICLLEEIQGSKLENFPIKKRVQLLLQAIRFLRIISPKLIKNDSIIPRKSGYHFVIHFIYYFFLSLIKQPAMFWSLFMFFKEFVWGSLHLLSNSEQTFVHADLGYGDNILLAGEISYLIDFDISVISNRNLEIANILACNWQDPEFCIYFVESAIKFQIIDMKQDYPDLRALMAYSAIVRIALSPKHEPQESELQNIQAIYERLRAHI